MSGRKRKAGRGPGEAAGAAAREARARAVVEAVVAELPPDVRALAGRVAVWYDRRVARHWIADGVEPDSLGLFSGPSLRDPDASESDEAPLITLFLDNLWDFCEGDGEAFDEEVRRTYLHELGHFLGLEEEDMGPRDLD